MMHFPPCFRFPPLLSQISPLFSENSTAFYILSVYFPPTLAMMHLCITQCTYWTPLDTGGKRRFSFSACQWPSKDSILSLSLALSLPRLRTRPDIPDNN